MLLDCKSLINGMLTLDPNKRFSITDIINHKWFQVDSDSFSLNSSVLSTTSNNNNNNNNSNNNISNDDYSIFQEFRCLIDKIEQMLVFDYFFKLKN